MSLVVGIGLTSSATTDQARSTIEAALVQVGSGWDDVSTLATTVRRRGHQALADLTVGTTIEIVLFEPSDLARVTVPNPSAAVGERAGTTSVAEAAALLAARTDVLLLPKQTGEGITVALAEAVRPGAATTDR